MKHEDDFFQGYVPGEEFANFLPIAYDHEGVSELPATGFYPTPQSEYKKLLEEVDCCVERGGRGLTDAEKALLSIMRPMIVKAYKLGRDSVLEKPTKRSCRQCNKGPVMAKNGKYCPECSAYLRKISNRLAQQRRREKLKCQTSQQLSP